VKTVNISRGAHKTRYARARARACRARLLRMEALNKAMNSVSGERVDTSDPGSPWPLSKISVQLEAKIYATFKSVNSFTVDNPFCCEERSGRFPAYNHRSNFIPPSPTQKIRKERSREREKERESILMQARFTARALSSLACCVLTFSGCNNY